MAAGPTYEPIATANGTGSSGSITFTSIPATYTDLVLICNGFGTNDQVNTYTKVNGSATGYSKTNLSGSGSAAASARTTSTVQWTMSDGPLGSGSSTSPMLMKMEFLNYSNTTTYKTMLARQNIVGATFNGTVASVNLWSNTAAIYQIEVYLQPGTNYYTTNATFTLYGIKAA